MTRRFLTFSVAYDYGGRACLRGSFDWRTDDIFFKKGVGHGGGPSKPRLYEKNYVAEQFRSFRYRTPIGEIL